MDNKQLLETIKQRFEALPPELQEAITSSKYQETLMGLQKKYGLTIEQLGDLERETTMVLLGMQSPKEYSKDLGTFLKLPQDSLYGLINEINELVFKAVRSSLQRIYLDMQTESEVQKTTPASGDPLKASGIEIEESIEEPVAPAPRIEQDDDLLEKSGIEIERGESAPEEKTPDVNAREDILKKIENPSLGGNIVSAKMGGAFSVPKKESTHDLPSLSKKTPSKDTDPYREPIE